MKALYKDFEIDATRKLSLAGIDLLYFSIFRKDGLEIVSDFTYGTDTEEVMIGYLKMRVDDYIENPQYYD